MQRKVIHQIFAGNQELTEFIAQRAMLFNGFVENWLQIIQTVKR